MSYPQILREPDNKNKMTLQMSSILREVDSIEKTHSQIFVRCYGNRTYS